MNLAEYIEEHKADILPELYKYADNILDDITWSYNGDSITKEDMIICRDICHKALGIQITKRATIFIGENGATHLHCPTCNVKLKYDTLSDHKIRCQECGQKIDLNIKYE